DPHAAQKIVVGMVTGEREYKIVLQAKNAERSLQRDPGIADLLHRAVEVRGDFASLDAVLDVGPHPVLNVIMHPRSAMNQRDARSMPPQIQSRFRRRILA